MAKPIKHETRGSVPVGHFVAYGLSDMTNGEAFSGFGKAVEDQSRVEAYEENTAGDRLSSLATIKVFSAALSLLFEQQNCLEECKKTKQYKNRNKSTDEVGYNRPGVKCVLNICKWCVWSLWQNLAFF